MAEKVSMRVGYAQTNELKPDMVIKVQMLTEMPFVRAAFLSDDGPRMEVETRLFGGHNFQNIMTAIALGVYFKVPADRIDQIVLVGKEFGKTAFTKFGAIHFLDNEAAKQWFLAQDLQGTAVLIKGSRGIRLEKVLET